MRLSSAISKYVVIKPRSGWSGLELPELWRYRELFFIFTWRDLKVRYKQTIIGILWAILQPFLLMVVFSIFFGNLAKIPSDGIPYPIFVFSGLLYWNYFSTSVSNGSNSLIENESIVKKIFFPRLLLPFSTSLTPLVDFCIGYIVLIGIMIFYHVMPSFLGMLLMPLLALVSFLTASGLGSFFSVVNVRFRDIRYALPFFIQLLMFVTPVIYPPTLLNEHYRWILALNPMTGIIEASRNSMIGNKSVDFHLLLVSAVLSIAIFLIGIFYFKRQERMIADVA